MSGIKKDRWTEDMVLDLPPGEHDNFDRKAGTLLTDSGRRDTLAKALSAFSNSGGGHLILGVADDGMIDGVPPFKGKTRTRERVEQLIPDLLSPPLQDFRVHEVEAATPSNIPAGQVVIVIDVADSMLAPHQTSGTKIYYCRSGGHSVPAPHVYLEALRGRQRFPNQTVVRVWFETVINPLLLLFESLRETLASTEWQWASEGGDVFPLRFINYGDIKNQASVGDRSNKEQFFEFYGEIAGAVDNYDVLLLQLSEKCKQLYEQLRKSRALETVYLDVVSSEEFLEIKPLTAGTEEVPKDVEAILTKLFGSRSHNERLDHLARYIIKRQAELEPSFFLSPFWNVYREVFMAVLDNPSANPFYEGVVEAKQALCQSVEGVISSLREMRRQLAIQHGVPFNEPPTKKDLW
jgi:hypothetical protein